MPIIDEDSWLAIFDLTHNTRNGSKTINASAFEHAVCLCVSAEHAQSRTNIMYVWSKKVFPNECLFEKWLTVIKTNDRPKDPLSLSLVFALA